MTDEITAEAAVRVTLSKLVPYWLSTGGDIDGLRALFGEVEAIADGTSTAPSNSAIDLYCVIRGGSKGTAEQVADFIGLIAETLRQVDVVEIAGWS